MDNFDPNKRAEGLGDLVAKITHALGIAKVATKVANMVGEEDCGCEARRQALNKLVPFKKENDATEGIKDEPPLQD